MIVLVTGASRGIGKAIAQKFYSNGHTVIVNSKSSLTALKEVADGLSGYYYLCDVGVESEVEDMFGYIHDKVGNIDVLINNAGIALKQGLFFDTTEDDFDKVFSTNVKGVYNCSKYAVHDFLAKGRGAIVNVSSVWGNKGGSCEAVYSASKGAVETFTKAVAKELVSANVTVNAVSPDITDTDMNAHLSKQDVAEYLKVNRRRKLLTPEEVAETVYKVANLSKTGKIFKV